MKKMITFVLLIALAAVTLSGCADPSEKLLEKLPVLTVPEPSMPQLPDLTHQPKSTENRYFNDQIDGRWYADAITLLPKEVSYESGKLVATCYIFNGYDSDMRHFGITFMCINGSDGMPIASGDFNGKHNWTIPAKGYIEQTFTFSGAALETLNAPLMDLTAACNFIGGTKDFFVNHTLDGRWEYDKVTAVPVEASCSNGTLTVVCRLVNGFSHPVTQVTTDHMTVYDAQGQVIASGDFRNQNQTIFQDQYITYTYSFSGEALKATDFDLSSVTVAAEFTQRVLPL